LKLTTIALPETYKVYKIHVIMGEEVTTVADNQNNTAVTYNNGGASQYDGFYDDYMDFTDYKSAVWIWTLTPPVVLFLGTLGNILSIVVWNCKKMRGSSTACYLTALAVSDLVVLYTGLAKHWIFYVFGIYIHELSEVGCKLHSWTVYVALSMSSWILIAVTVERVMSVLFPFSVRRKCTRMTAVIILCLLTVVIMVLNSYWLIDMQLGQAADDYDYFELDPEPGNYDNDTAIFRCGVNADVLWLHVHVWPNIEMFINCLLPFCVLLVGNVSIIVKLAKNKRMSRQLTMLLCYPGAVVGGGG
jgi:hypothetical protein